MAEPGFFELQFQKAEAIIQSKLGEFMQLKQKLMPFRQSDNQAIRDKANSLYERQVRLEQVAPAMIERVTAIKTAYEAQGLPALIANAGDVRRAASFAKDAKEYKDDADRFLASKGAAGPRATAWQTNAALMTAVALGGLGLAYLIKKR